MPGAVEPHVLVIAVAFDDEATAFAEHAGAVDADHHVVRTAFCHADQVQGAARAVTLTRLGDVLAVLLPGRLFLFLALLVGEQLSGFASLSLFSGGF